MAPAAILDDDSQVVASGTSHYASKINDSCVVYTGTQTDHRCHIGNNCDIASCAIRCVGVTPDDNVFVGAGLVITNGV